MVLQGSSPAGDNVNAVQAIANVVKSSLGPVGLDKVRVIWNAMQICRKLASPVPLLANAVPLPSKMTLLTMLFVADACG